MVTVKIKLNCNNSTICVHFALLLFIHFFFILNLLRLFACIYFRCCLFSFMHKCTLLQFWRTKKRCFHFVLQSIFNAMMKEVRKNCIDRFFLFRFYHNLLSSERSCEEICQVAKKCSIKAWILNRFLFKFQLFFIWITLGMYLNIK